MQITSKNNVDFGTAHLGTAPVPNHFQQYQQGDDVLSQIVAEFEAEPRLN